MNVLRSWNPLSRRLTGALLPALAMLAVAAAPASARRNTNLDASAEAGETPPSETSPAPPTEETTPEAPAPSPRHKRRSHCSISLEAPATLAAGEALTVTGRLTCDEPGESAGAPVQIFSRSAGTHGSEEAANATTGEDGTFAATVTPPEANAYLYARSGRARSPREGVRVLPVVTLAGPAHGAVLPMSTRHGRALSPIHFSGTVSPTDAGAKVTLQRERPLGSGAWRPVAVSQVASDGSFAFIRSFHAPGALLLRAFVHRHAHHLPAISETLSYQVAQANTTALTISLTPETVPYGEAVTIAGKLAGGEGKTVTLFARAGGGDFSPVATATTTEGGAYTFTQTPLRNTEYRVVSGTQSSVALRAQVTFALTAVASATDVAAGEGPTITGTVAPASPGTHVFLMRVPAPPGVRMETLGYATVGPGSEYAIAVPPASAGTATYRVRIARVNGGLRGALSAPVVITTAP